MGTHLFSIKCVYKTLKYLSILTVIWPVFDSNKFVRFFAEVAFYIILISYILVIIPLTTTSLINIKHSANFTITFAELMIAVEGLFNVLYSKYKMKQFESIIKQIKIYFKNALKHEKTLLNMYASTHTLFDIYIGVNYAIAVLSFIFGPILISNQTLPLDVWYPFPIKSKTLYKTIIYMHQALTIAHTSILVVYDSIATTLLWFLAARFELLQYDFQLISSAIHFKSNVHKHQHLIKSADEVVDFVRYLAWKTIAAVTIHIISASLQVLHHGPFTIIVQFVFIANIAIMRAISYCWAANNLMEKSEGLAWSIYNCCWIKELRSMRTSMLIIMQRCQKPVTIKVSGFISALSFGFFINYIYMIYSTFVALRAILGV